MAEFSVHPVVECVFLFVAFLAAYMLMLSIPAALRRRGILTGSPPVSFWRMMLLRAACAAVCVSLIYFTPESRIALSPSKIPSTGKGPVWVLLVVIAVDAAWAIVRGFARLWRRRRTP